MDYLILGPRWDVHLVVFSTHPVAHTLALYIVETKLLGVVGLAEGTTPCAVDGQVSQWLRCQVGEKCRRIVSIAGIAGIDYVVCIGCIACSFSMEVAALAEGRCRWSCKPSS